jgi:GNAT superfamily N-acetyltransferase
MVVDAPVAGFTAQALAGTGVALRAVAPSDAALIASLYATTREEELRVVPWSGEQKRAFTDWQSGLQEEHYRRHYAGAERLVIERDGEAIGRIYVHVTGAEVRLMDVTLLAAHRGQGIGTRLVRALIAHADGLARPCSLHVEPFNPARRLYQRLGFATREVRGLYEFMVRAPS